MRLQVLVSVVAVGCSAGKDTSAPTDADLYPCATEPAGAADTEADGPFVDVRLGRYGACALDADGRATCWGCANDDQPDETFAVLDLEYDHACGITTAGGGVCWAWGPDAPGSDYASAPDGTWLDVAVGLHHTCWIALDGSISCFGANRDGQLDTPAGQRWVKLDAGDRHTCAIDADGCAACWGLGDDHTNDGRLDTPRDWDCGVADVDCGEEQTCWLSSGGTAVCNNRPSEDKGGGHLYPWEPDEQAVDVGVGLVPCLVPAEGDARCGGTFLFDCDRGVAPGASSVDAATYAACLLLDDGSTACWGAGIPRDVDGDPICRHGPAATVFGE